jgi:membrane associated rhomboid family serine protease
MNRQPDLQFNRYSSFPFMTMGIIILNMLVLIGQIMLEDSNSELYEFSFIIFGSVPALVMNQEGAGALASLTSIFMHADIFHLGSNMIALWAFARRVEDVCGPWRFLAY